ncbi:MAG: hypothetical protein L6271_05300, partial [Desulfobacteraceae bacterium]|nr:hypothetical protein [Desulfobacteraceae bacterium]
MSRRRRVSFLKVFTAKHFQALGYNLSGVTSNTVLFPHSGLHLALNIDFRAFLEVISANFPVLSMLQSGASRYALVVLRSRLSTF